MFNVLVWGGNYKLSILGWKKKWIEMMEENIRVKMRGQQWPAVFGKEGDEKR